MTGFTSDVSQGTLIRTGLTQCFGIGCVFVPLSTVTFGTLAPALRARGPGSFNLMRNIGASIGTTAESTLVEHITPYRQVVRDYALELNLATLSGRAMFGMIWTVMIARFRSTIGRSLARVQPS